MSDVPTRDELRKEIENLSTDIKKFISEHGNDPKIGERLREKDVMAAADTLLDQLNELFALDDERDTSGINGFFDAVSASVVSAQKDLDAESERYLATQPLVDRMFAIPKASAEFEFEFSNFMKTKKGFIVSTSTKRRSERLAQKISFDIVAAPAPPTEKNEAARGHGKSAIMARRIVGETAIYNKLATLFDEERLAYETSGGSEERKTRCALFAAAASKKELLILIGAGEKIEDGYVVIRTPKNEASEPFANIDVVICRPDLSGHDRIEFVGSSNTYFENDLRDKRFNLISRFLYSIIQPPKVQI